MLDILYFLVKLFEFIKKIKIVLVKVASKAEKCVPVVVEKKCACSIYLENALNCKRLWKFFSLYWDFYLI